MFIRFLSRYHPRYVRSLVYMLQSSEYDASNYLKWVRRARNFCRIEHRKSLTYTAKTVLLLVIAWGILVSLYLLGLYFLFKGGNGMGGEVLRYMFSAVTILAAPFVLSYVILVPLWFIRVLVQLPTEFWITRKARKTLDAHPGRKIAIAGSFGKTSMREILKTVLSEGKKVAAPPHSYNTPLGISKFIQNLRGDEEILIFELGEYYPGDVKKLSELVRPELGVIAGVNEAHLEKFKTLDQTVATIFELADWIERTVESKQLKNPTGDFTKKTKGFSKTEDLPKRTDFPLYVNGENSLAREHASSKSLLYSRDGIPGIWKVESPHTDLSGTTFTLVGKDFRLDLKTELLGLHQIGPLVAAADMALRLGISPNDVQTGIARTKPFDHRLEPSMANGVTTLDDSYNGNPDGVRAVIEYLASIAGHRRWYVTPGLVEMGEKTESVHREIGRQLAEAGIEKVVLLKNSVTSYIEAGLQEARFRGELIWFDDALSLFAALPQLTVDGDVVLLQNDWPDQYQ